MSEEQAGVPANINDKDEAEILPQQESQDHQLKDTSDDAFLDEIDQQISQIQTYLTAVKDSEADELNKLKFELDEELESKMKLEENIIKLDFLCEITDEIVNTGKLLWIENIGIVSSQLIKEFKDYYNLDVSRLVRDATKHQKIVITKEEEYKNIETADDASDALKESAKYKEIGQIQYMMNEDNQMTFRIQNQGQSEVAAIFQSAKDQEKSMIDIKQAIYQVQILKLLRNQDCVVSVYEELIYLNDAKFLITCYCSIQEKSVQNLQDLARIWNEKVDDSGSKQLSEVSLLYYLFQLACSLQYLHSRNVSYGSSSYKKSILIMRDSSIKLKDMTHAIAFDNRDLKGDKKLYIGSGGNQSQEPRTKKELVQNDREELAKMIESIIKQKMNNDGGLKQLKYIPLLIKDLLNKEMNFSSVIVKWGDILQQETEKLIPLVESMIQESRYESVLRILEFTRYRNLLIAMIRRAEDQFEQNEQHKQTHLVIQQQQRLSFSIFENQLLGIYPKAIVYQNQLYVDNEDLTWRHICLLILQYPPTHLKSYLRQIVYQFTKISFDELKITNSKESLEENTQAVMFYTIILHKLRNKALLKDTAAKLSQGSKQVSDMNILYKYYQMKQEWRLGHFKQAVELSLEIQAIDSEKGISLHPLLKQRILDCFFLKSYYSILSEAEQAIQDIKNYKKQIELYESSVVTTKHHAKYTYLIALNHLMTQNFKEAQSQFSSALALFEGYSDSCSKWSIRCLYEQARCHFYLKNSDKAKYLISKAIKLSHQGHLLEPLLAFIEIVADNQHKVGQLLELVRKEGHQEYVVLLGRYYGKQGESDKLKELMISNSDKLSLVLSKLAQFDRSEHQTFFKACLESLMSESERTGVPEEIINERNIQQKFNMMNQLLHAQVNALLKK